MTALHAAYCTIPSAKFNFFRPFRILAISTSKHRSVNSFSESTVTLCASSSSHTQGTQALFHPRWLTDERNRTLSSSPQCQSKFDVALRLRRRVSRRPVLRAASVLSCDLPSPKCGERRAANTSGNKALVWGALPIHSFLAYT